MYCEIIRIHICLGYSNQTIGPIGPLAIAKYGPTLFYFRPHLLLVLVDKDLILEISSSIISFCVSNNKEQQNVGTDKMTTSVAVPDTTCSTVGLRVWSRFCGEPSPGFCMPC